MLRGFDTALIRLAQSSKFDIIELAELKWQIEYGAVKDRAKNQKALRALQNNGIETLVPFVTDGRLVALLIFGGRSGGHQLYARDTEFLNLIRAGISPALENAAKFEEIRGLYEKLSEADKVKSEFISVVSHRFRTPLSALRWNLETVLDTARVNKDAKQMLVDSQDRTEFLVNTLDGLFDALAIENSALKINKESFNIQKAVHPFVSVFERKLGEKGIAFHYSVPSMSIVGDQKRILFIINTLLTNALQYTTEGDVSLRVAKRDADVAIEVSDTGVGIAPKDQEKIFEKFYRGKSAKSLNPDGQGLGLYLVKQLAQLHKGSVVLESAPSKGTKITVLLPIK